METLGEDKRGELERKVVWFQLSPFQKIVCVFLLQFMEHGVKSGSDIEELCRKVEKPASFVLNKSGDQIHEGFQTWRGLYDAYFDLVPKD